MSEPANSGQSDNRTVEIIVRQVQPEPGDIAPSHRWEAVAHVDGEMVENSRCFTRSVALHEAQSAVMAAGVDWEGFDD